MKLGFASTEYKLHVCPGDDRRCLGPISTTNLTLEIHKLLHRTIHMRTRLSFEHITQQLPYLVRDIIWVIKRTKKTLV